MSVDKLRHEFIKSKRFELEDLFGKYKHFGLSHWDFHYLLIGCVSSLLLLNLVLRNLLLVIFYLYLLLQLVNFALLKDPLTLYSNSISSVFSTLFMLLYAIFAKGELKCDLTLLPEKEVQRNNLVLLVLLLLGYNSNVVLKLVKNNKELEAFWVEIKLLTSTELFSFLLGCLFLFSVFYFIIKLYSISYILVIIIIFSLLSRWKFNSCEVYTNPLHVLSSKQYSHTRSVSTRGSEFGKRRFFSRDRRGFDSGIKYFPIVQSLVTSILLIILFVILFYILIYNVKTRGNNSFSLHQQVSNFLAQNPNSTYGLKRNLVIVKLCLFLTTLVVLVLLVMFTLYIYYFFTKKLALHRLLYNKFVLLIKPNDYKLHVQKLLSQSTTSECHFVHDDVQMEVCLYNLDLKNHVSKIETVHRYRRKLLKNRRLYKKLSNKSSQFYQFLRATTSKTVSKFKSFSTNNSNDLFSQSSYSAPLQSSNSDFSDNFELSPERLTLNLNVVPKADESEEYNLDFRAGSDDLELNVNHIYAFLQEYMLNKYNLKSLYVNLFIPINVTFNYQMFLLLSKLLQYNSQLYNLLSTLPKPECDKPNSDQVEENLRKVENTDSNHDDLHDSGSQLSFDVQKNVIIEIHDEIEHDIPDEIEHVTDEKDEEEEDIITDFITTTSPKNSNSNHTTQPSFNTTQPTSNTLNYTQLGEFGDSVNPDDVVDQLVIEIKKEKNKKKRNVKYLTSLFSRKFSSHSQNTPLDQLDNNVQTDNPTDTVDDTQLNLPSEVLGESSELGNLVDSSNPNSQSDKVKLDEYGDRGDGVDDNNVKEIKDNESGNEYFMEYIVTHYNSESKNPNTTLRKLFSATSNANSKVELKGIRRLNMKNNRYIKFTTPNKYNISFTNSSNLNPDTGGLPSTSPFNNANTDNSVNNSRLGESSELGNVVDKEENEDFEDVTQEAKVNEIMDELTRDLNLEF